MLSGLYSGSIGGSGSLFISMVLIHKHVRPEVVTASSSVLVFIASSTASIQYIVGGYIYLDYGLILFFTSFIGSMIGILMIKKAVEKRGKPSLLVWAFGIQLLIGAVMLTGYQIYHFYTQIEEGDSSFGFNNFC